jgi:eukaryotic-like serine/threonine-protein kinase
VLARSYSKQQQHDQALALLLEAEPVIIERFGKDHSRHMTLLGELLGVAFRKPDWPKALFYAEMVYTMLRAKVGEQHDQTQVALTNWGRALYESGNAAQASLRLRAAYQQLLLSQGKTTWQSQDAAYVLACVELELNNLDAAEVLIRSLDLKTLVAASGNQQWGPALDALRGLLLLKRGNRAAAKPLLKSGLDALATDPQAMAERINRTLKSAFEQAFGRL